MTADRLPTFDLSDFVRAGSYTDLVGVQTIEASRLEPLVDETEGTGPRILTRDFGPWSIEFMFDAHDRFCADQIQFHPEGVGLDPDADPEAVAELCPFAWWSTIVRADDVAGVPVEAVYGTNEPEDEVVVLLANGIDLHYQPMESDRMLRLVRSRHQSDRDRRLIRRTFPRLR